VLVGIANQGCELVGAEITYGEEMAGGEGGGQRRGGGGIASLGELVDCLKGGACGKHACGSNE